MKDQNQDDRVVIVSNELIIICYDNNMNITCEESSWIVDSGASYHVTPRREFFSSYTPGDFGTLKMGNDGLTKVIGVGEVSLKTESGTSLLLKDVKHALDIRLNLISIGKLNDDGYYSHEGDGKWKLTKGSLVVAKGMKHSSLYVLQAKISNGMCNVVEDVTALWHKRLCHMSEKGMSILVKNNVLSGVKSAKLEKCAHCLAGKQKRVSFRSHSPSRKSELLELVHSDVCGPMPIKTVGGAAYFVTFIDDSSRKVWVYFLKTKDQVLNAFKQFQVLVERQTGKKLKCIRSDNGGEYIGAFDEYCKQQGIRHQKTPPKTPQLNGIAERMNRTLVERVRCMISDAKLSKSFWGEALSTAVHVINLSPTVALDGDVPERVWLGKDISYEHLRVFGCRAFVHIPKDERSKLDVKTRECIFLGYGSDEFGYRMYDPIEKKILRSRDVVFMEDQTIEDIQKTEKTVPQSSHSYVDINPVPSTVVHDQVENPTDDEIQGEQQVTDNTDDHVDDNDMAPTTTLRRSTRGRHPSSRYSVDQYVLLTDSDEPECFEEVIENENKIGRASCRERV